MVFSKRIAFGFFLVLFGAGCAGEDGEKKTVSDPDRAALLINDVPVYHKDVERLGKYLTSFFYNISPEYASSVVLVNSLIPRAASLSHHADQIEPLRVKMEAIRKRIVEGKEDFDSVGREVSDYPVGAEDPASEFSNFLKVDYLIGEWLFSLKPGEISQPILTRHGWYLVQVLEQHFQPNYMKSTVRFHAIILAFEKDPDFDRTLQQWVEEAEIKITDPEYGKIVPEWVKFRPGARTWKPVDLSENKAK